MGPLSRKNVYILQGARPSFSDFITTKINSHLWSVDILTHAKYADVKVILIYNLVLEYSARSHGKDLAVWEKDQLMSFEPLPLNIFKISQNCTLNRINGPEKSTTQCNSLISCFNIFIGMLFYIYCCVIQHNANTGIKVNVTHIAMIHAPSYSTIQAPSRGYCGLQHGIYWPLIDHALIPRRTAYPREYYIYFKWF